MKKGKKTLGFIVLFCTILIISACNNGNQMSEETNSETNGSTSSDMENNDSASNSNEVVTLTFMGWEASPLETAAVEEGIKVFESQYPNIKINYTPGLAGAEYNAKLLTAAASKSMPDVMFMMTDAYRTFVSKGALTDITEKFDSEYPLEDFIDSSRTIMNVDGKIYGVSSCTVSPIVYYNKDVFDAAGISYPSSDPNNAWTIDEFREMARELTTDEIFGCYGLETVADTLNAQILSNGGTRFSEDFTQSTMNTEAVREVFETIKAVRYEDKSAPGATTLDSVGMTASQMLQTGKIAMLVDGSWALQELAASGMNIGMAPLPSYGEVLTTGQAHLHCISATSQYQDEAWEFVKFLSGLEYQGALVKSGLWMPNRLSMYEEDMVNEWYDENVHGDSYKPMLDYFKNAKVDPSALQLSAQIRDIIIEESTLYFADEQDVTSTLERIDNRSNEAIQEELE